AWKRTCASPDPRRWRRRSSVASRPGRTGSSSDPTPSASAVRCSATARRAARSSTRTALERGDSRDHARHASSTRRPATHRARHTTAHRTLARDEAMTTIDYSQKIPNNVDLSSDKRLQRALEEWQPSYIEWWSSVGPTDFNTKDVYLRTAVGVDKDG